MDQCNRCKKEINFLSQYSKEQTVDQRLVRHHSPPTQLTPLMSQAPTRGTQQRARARAVPSCSLSIACSTRAQSACFYLRIFTSKSVPHHITRSRRQQLAISANSNHAHPVCVSSERFHTEACRVLPDLRDLFLTQYFIKIRRTLITLSRPAETTKSLSGVHATDDTLCSWPFSVR